jgi:long-chain acyl-CoA synthetase
LQKKLEKLNFRVHFFENVIKKGGSVQDHKKYKVTRENVLTFSYTSGTTGPPKAAMITHGNVLAYLGAQKNNECGMF